jgi:hypothetical protein
MLVPVLQLISRVCKTVHPLERMHFFINLTLRTSQPIVIPHRQNSDLACANFRVSLVIGYDMFLNLNCLTGIVCHRYEVDLQ